MLLLLVLSLVSLSASSEVYSSYANVKNLHFVENHLVSILGKYITQEESRLETLKVFKEFVIQANGNKTGDDYVGYPTNQFSVIHRFVADWANLEDYTNSLNEDIKEAFKTYRKYYPTQVDLKGAAKALHRLQDIYKISASHFTQGLPLGPDTRLVGQPLFPKSLLALAQAAYDEAQWTKCAGWSLQAYKLVVSYNPQDKLWFDITDHLAYCLYRADDTARALEITKVMLVHYPSHDRLLGNLKFFTENVPKEKRDVNGEVLSMPDVTQIQYEDDTELFFVPKKCVGCDEVEMSEEEIDDKIQDSDYLYWGERVKRYKKLCKEAPEYPPALQKQIESLHCFYKGNTPRTIIKPIKVEEVFPSPRIWIFHDILSEYEADYLIYLAQPKLDRATVHNKETGKLENAEYRVSKTAWLDMDLPEDAAGVVRRLNRRMEDASELSHEYAELQQVNNYGMAGQYEPHYDMKTLEDIKSQSNSDAFMGVQGNRQATMLIYLSDVKAGGATVFSETSARLLPIKVNIYGMAGQYEPHYDMATKGEKAFDEHLGGNRVATLLLYMGNTNAGGATVFVDAGARISTVKNAAVFWYNLLPNGEPDLLTRHAGCPVLAGTKWVMNKWFHTNDQVFNRPCGLEKGTRDKGANIYKYTVS